MRNPSRAFTLIEVLVIISIIALLMAFLLPALRTARNYALMSQSRSNLRNMGAAYATYSSAWNCRQFTLCKDNLSAFGENEAYFNFEDVNGHEHPPVLLGWGSEPRLRGYWMGHPVNWGMCQPLVFPGGPSHLVGFGGFRIPNARQFNRYLNGRFYDTVSTPRRTRSS